MKSPFVYKGLLKALVMIISRATPAGTVATAKRNWHELEIHKYLQYIISTFLSSLVLASRPVSYARLADKLPNNDVNAQQKDKKSQGRGKGQCVLRGVESYVRHLK